MRKPKIPKHRSISKEWVEQCQVGTRQGSGRSEKSPKPWIHVESPVQPRHKTRQGPAIPETKGSFHTGSERRKHFCISRCGDCGFAEGQKEEDPLFRSQSKGAESARPPAGIGPVLVTPPAIWGKTWPLKALCLSPAPLYSLEGEAYGYKKLQTSSYLWRPGIYSKKERPIASQSIVHPH